MIIPRNSNLKFSGSVSQNQAFLIPRGNPSSATQIDKLNIWKLKIPLSIQNVLPMLFFLMAFSIEGLADWVKLANSRLNPRIVYTMVMDTATKYVYAGTNAGAMYLSTDSCKYWRELNNSWISIDASYSGYVESFAIKDNYLFACSSNRGVWRSANNGNSWTEANNGFNTYCVNALTVSGNSIYAGTNIGVYVSSDNGNSWTAINDGISDVDVNEIIVNGNKIYLGTSKGTYCSENNGTTW